MTHSPEDKQVKLAAIAREVAACRSCPLHDGRTHVVPGTGPANADIMFIGEAPGFHEDQQGLPFVGASGKYLSKLLEDVGISRKAVFITNVVKCRPPDNRDPKKEELAACEHFLNRQIAVINPRIIVTLGRYSMARYFPGGRITRIHGLPRRADGRIYLPMFHPAAVLRDPRRRPEMEADMRRVLELVNEAEQDAPPDDSASDGPDDVVQLNLF